MGATDAGCGPSAKSDTKAAPRERAGMAWRAAQAGSTARQGVSDRAWQGVCAVFKGETGY